LNHYRFNPKFTFFSCFGNNDATIRVNRNREKALFQPKKGTIMYKDLAEAVEALKDQGAKSLSGISEEELESQLGSMKIVKTHRFDSGTDPSDESTLYELETNDGEICFLVLGFGIYKDPKKSGILKKIKALTN